MSLLRTPVQPGLFAAACAVLVPWLFMRVFRELSRSDGLADYLRQVFVTPIKPWFERGWRWYRQFEWYDWPVSPAWVLIALTEFWPQTGVRLISWIRSGHS